MDGVIYPFADVYFEWLVEAYGADPATLRKPTGYYLEVPKWDFYKCCQESVAAKFLYSRGEPLPGAVETIKLLKSEGHEIHFITARLIEQFGPLTEQNTYEWLKDRDIPWDTVTFSHDKTVVPVDIFLDDKIENVDAVLATGTDAWLMYDPPRTDQLYHPRFIKSFDDFYLKVLDLQVARAVDNYNRSVALFRNRFSSGDSGVTAAAA